MGKSATDTERLRGRGLLVEDGDRAGGDDLGRVELLEDGRLGEVEPVGPGIEAVADKEEPHIPLAVLAVIEPAMAGAEAFEIYIDDVSVCRHTSPLSSVRRARRHCGIMQEGGQQKNQGAFLQSGRREAGGS